MYNIIRKAAAALGAVIGILLLAGAGTTALFFYLNAPPKKNPRPARGVTITQGSDARVEVMEGESARAVGERLEEALLIRSGFLWNMVSRFTETPLKQGVYLVSAPMPLLRLHALLQTGRQELVRVTIPEGVTLTKMARILENADICAAGAFLEAASDRTLLDEYHIPAGNAQGYLYPDTYLFPAGYPARLIVKTMADTFFKKLDEIRGPAPAENAAGLHEKVTLASIIEREYRVDDEAPLMAGVFYNRLKTGMKLQSCATVEYVITENQGKPHPSRLFYRDLEIDDPYNTYIVKGLPPGPIAAPGSAALASVYHPAQSDYLYFNLADADAGRHFFSTTLDDHNNAATLYVKARAGE